MRLDRHAACLLLAAVASCAGPHAAAPPPVAVAAPAAKASASPAPAGRLTEQERASAIAYLEQTRAAFLRSVDGLSDAQLRWKPAPDRWSVLEVAEHVALAEDRIFTLVSQKLVTAPMTPELRSQLRPGDDWIRARVSDRSVPRQAVEPLRPTGRFPSLAAALEGFSRGRARALDYIRTTADPLHDHATVQAAAGALDGYQWLIFLSAHCARHTAQIDEVRADRGFPRG